jgi:tRNA(Ile)-lysidine synthase
MYHELRKRGTSPVSDAEVDALFADLAKLPALALAVSGGPDSTALLVTAALWRKKLADGPRLVAITVDHGLRAASRREAERVAALAKKLGVEHQTVRWTGKKPATGLQEKARIARYELLAREARKRGVFHLLTAHTLDDQAETVLFRMARGSGLAGLGAMARVTPLGDLWLIRPFLALPKERLIATLRARKVAFAQDPSNRDPHFTRVRWRKLSPKLAEEGLDAERLGTLAERARRANAALEAVVDVAAHQIASATPGGVILIEMEAFRNLPAEIALRLLGRAVATVGNEGPVELGKLEKLLAFALTAIKAAGAQGVPRRSTLAGAMLTVTKGRITVETAPARRNSAKSPQKRRSRG